MKSKINMKAFSLALAIFFMGRISSIITLIIKDVDYTADLMFLLASSATVISISIWYFIFKDWV
jgi:hypothetical protein